MAFIQCATVLALLCLDITIGLSGDRLSLMNNGERKPRAKRESKGNISKPTVRSVHVTSNVSARFATVYFETTLYNEHSDGQTGQFIVEIPTSAFISSFSMVVNNREIKSRVYPKEVAQKMYDEAVKNGSTAGQVSSQPPRPGRDMDIFSMNVNIASGATVVFKLTYKELLERKLCLFTQRINIKPKQEVETVTFIGYYTEPQGFTSFSYNLPGSDVKYTSSSEFTTLEDTPNTRVVTYAPQKLVTLSGEDNGGEISISYDVIHNADGGLLIMQNNHFVHYFSPSGLQPMDKNIVFVIDISGSMGGGLKIENARDAMLAILDQVRTTDLISIIVFESTASTWNTQPVFASATNIKQAKNYVRMRVKASGGTNINSALLKGLSLLRKSEMFVSNGNMAQIIVLLTDGNPSVGEDNTFTIRRNIITANELVGASIFCLGFGFDLKYEFLEALAFENGGFAQRIYDEADAAVQLETFYQQISSPLLLNIELDYKTNEVAHDTTKNNFAQYYDGSEIVVAGEMQSSVVTMEAEISAKSKTSNSLKYNVSPHISQSSDTSEAKDFAEQLFAYKKIKDMIQEMNAIKGVNAATYDDMRIRALNMSLEYGFVTPLTSLLVIDTDEFRNENALDTRGGNTVHDSTSASNRLVAISWTTLLSLMCLYIA